jgi:hypothetical protein
MQFIAMVWGSNPTPSDGLIILDDVWDTLESLPWGMQVTAHLSSTSMATFRLLLSNKWLDNNVIDMALWWMSIQVSLDPTLCDVIVAPLLFFQNMLGSYKTGNYDFAGHRRYQQAIMSGDQKQIVTILHLPSHWVWSVMHFEQMTFQFGELLQTRLF